MSKRVRALAWFVWAVSVFLLLGTALLPGAQSSPSGSADDQSGGAGPILLVALICLITVGAVVASRRPANALGWIFSGLGLVLALGGFATNYAGAALPSGSNPMPGEPMAAWVANWATGPSMYGAFIFLFLLFPDGQVLTPRWRPVAWLAIAASLMLWLVDSFSPGPFTRDFPDIVNPLGISVLMGLRDVLELPLFLLDVVLLLLAVVSLVLRFRRSSGDERQQLKWFASSGVLLALIFATGPILWQMPSVGNVVWPFLFAIAVSVVPIAVGIAILKYRLYDIDVIINRTLVYGSLTTLLAVIYWVSVALLQALLTPVLGEGNDLAIVISTLGIAALFMPLRARIQVLIDRRFYRRKYDAAMVLAGFGAAIRDEVDLSSLSEQLVGVVQEIMQPAYISLWLRSNTDERSKELA